MSDPGPETSGPGEPTDESSSGGPPPDQFEALASLALAAVDGVEAVTISVRVGRGGHLDSAGAAPEPAAEIESVQSKAGRGPSSLAVESGEEIVEALPSRRWPEVSAAAIEAGLGWVWVLPATGGTRSAGALSLWWPAEPPDSRRDPVVPRLLARLLASVLASAELMTDLTDANDNLHEALESRTVIGQAQGLLMARQKIDERAAFDILRRASQRTNRKLRDIAGELVSSFQEQQTPGS